MAKQRLDQRLVTDQLAPTRSRAQSLICEGKVLVDGVVVKKNGLLLEENNRVTLNEPDHPYVSRGGLKLAHALSHWGLEVNHLECLDIGASTGGFADCLLQKGARQVVAVDVGTAQLHPKLQGDSRIELWEKTNIKDFAPGRTFDLVVMDLSFISLKQVLPLVVGLMRRGGKIIALLKPQFELGPQSRNSRGIVKKPELYGALKDEMLTLLRKLGLSDVACCDSPIKGGDGNIEFLLFGKLE